jgi:hypothetical protein
MQTGLIKTSHIDLANSMMAVLFEEKTCPGNERLSSALGARKWAPSALFWYY